MYTSSVSTQESIRNRPNCWCCRETNQFGSTRKLYHQPKPHLDNGSKRLKKWRLLSGLFSWEPATGWNIHTAQHQLIHHVSWKFQGHEMQFMGKLILMMRVGNDFSRWGDFSNIPVPNGLQRREMYIVLYCRWSSLKWFNVTINLHLVPCAGFALAI